MPGLYGNRNAGNPNAFTYVADTSLKARNANDKKIAAMRVTGQLTPKNKLQLLLRLSEELQRLGVHGGRRAVPPTR